jgi:hypothetical protein
MIYSISNQLNWLIGGLELQFYPFAGTFRYDRACTNMPNTFYELV